MHRGTEFAVACFALLLFSAWPLATHAQDTGAQQPNPQSQTKMGKHQDQHPSRLEWLSKELSLTDDQKAKVKPILDDEEKQFKAMREDTSLSQDQRHDKMKQIHDTANAQINDLLTPDQQKKFAQLKERRKGHHEGQKANPPDES